MATARARMLELSPLINATARLHFLAITPTGVIAGGRADITVQNDKSIIDFIADNESITLSDNDKKITVTANKKGITL